MRIIGKLLILLLVFTLGFASAFGALFGVGYYAYTNLSLDKAGVNTDMVFDREAAEVQLSSLTIADLVAEIQSLQGISDKVTLDMLVLRYGLIIPEEVDSAIPLSARTLPINKLFSEEGLYTVLDELYIGQLLTFEKGELIPGTIDEYVWYQQGTTDEVTGIYTVLVNYTLGDLVKQNFDVNKILADLTISTALNLRAEAYSSIYIDEDGVLAPVYDFGSDMKVWVNSDGTMVSSAIGAIAEIPVSELSTSLDGLSVASLLGYVEYSDNFYSYELRKANGTDIVVLKEQGGLTAELSDLTVADFSNGKLDERIHNIEIYTVLGYTYDEETDKYYDQDGEEVTGPMSIIVGSVIGNVGSDINDMTVGEVCGFTRVDVYGDGSEIKWYTTYSEVDPSINEEAEGVMVSIADLKISELGDNDTVTSRIETITVADALGYKPAENGDGYVDKNGDPVTGVIGTIAGTQLKDIQSEIDDSTIGELCGFTAVEDEDGNITWYTTYSEEDPSLNEEAEGVMAVMADLKVSELKDNDKITARIETITVADSLGYTPDPDGDGYLDKNGLAVTGVMAVIAGTQLMNIQSKVDETMIGELCGFTKIEDEDGNITWYSTYSKDDPSLNEEAVGVMAVMADLKVNELKDDDKITARIETITVAEALGYTEVAGGGYVDKQNQPVKGVMSIIADTELKNIQSKVDESSVGEVSGFIPVEENGETKWYSVYKGENDPANVEASGVMNSIADLTVSDLKNNELLTSRIKETTVANALGYMKAGDTYVYGETYPEEQIGKPVTGVMGVIAGAQLKDIQSKVDESMTGELMGLTLTYDEDGNEVWLDSNEKPVHVLMNKIAGTPFSGISSITDTLTIDDIVSPEDRNTGFIQLIPDGTTIDGIADAVQHEFETTTLSEFVSKGIISVSGLEDAFKDDPAVDGELGDLTLQGLLILVATRDLR